MSNHLLRRAQIARRHRNSVLARRVCYPEAHLVEASGLCLPLWCDGCLQRGAEWEQRLKMGLDLVNYDAKAREAVIAFWGDPRRTRQGQIPAGRPDRGERTGRTTGRSMAGFMALVIDVVKANGLADAEIHQKRSAQALPGYFQATKAWDLVFTRGGRLVGAMAFQSQVGPAFHPSLDRQTAEAIGAAHDFWGPYRTGAFGGQSRPFAGWMMLVEDAPGSRLPVVDPSPHFPVRPEFQGASCVQRFDLLGQRLIHERLYTTACVLTSPRTAGTSGEYGELSGMTGLRAFVAALAGHCAAEAVR